MTNQAVYTGKDAMRPQHLDDFTGQPDLAGRIDVLLRSARDRSQLPDHILLAGPPGLGKTTLAHIVHNELELPLVTVSGPGLEKPADVIPLLQRRGGPAVVFIDEIHRMGKAAEETLYPAMEDGTIPIRIGEGSDADMVELTVTPSVLVAATTQVGLISAPLRDRFGFHGRLRPYSEEALSHIVATNGTKLGLEISPKAAEVIASRSRGTPRVANQLLSRVRDVAQLQKLTQVPESVAVDALDQFGIDKLGLDEVGRLILTTLCNQFHGGPVGLTSLASAVGETPDTIATVYEPHLLRSGLMQRTTQGRVATAQGFTHVNVATPHGWSF